MRRHRFCIILNRMLEGWQLNPEVKLIPDMDTAELLQMFAGRRVLVAGDLVLDHYLEGSVTRISPEAPVPVVSLGRNSEKWIPGGAANVALNVLSLGGLPSLAGVTGADREGEVLVDLLSRAGVEVSAVTTDASRPTTVKTRVMGRNHQLIRIDRENTEGIPDQVRNTMLKAMESLLPTMDSVLLEDYNKGVLTEPVIHWIQERAALRRLPVAVDPKLSNFWEYRGSTLFKPNRHEAKAALGTAVDDAGEAARAAEVIRDRLKAEAVLLTLGSAGSILADGSGESPRHIPTAARHVFDVSGAGDSVIAVMGLAISCKMDLFDAARIAGLAAAAVCAEPGVYAVKPDDVIREARRFE